MENPSAAKLFFKEYTINRQKMRIFARITIYLTTLNLYNGKPGMLKSIILFTESVKFAWDALIKNKLRTLLSLLGISIGIFCIITVLAAVDSLKKILELLRSMSPLYEDYKHGNYASIIEGYKNDEMTNVN